MKPSKRKTFIALINITMLVVAVFIVKMNIGANAESGEGIKSVNPSTTSIYADSQMDYIHSQKTEKTQPVIYSTSIDYYQDPGFLYTDDLVSSATPELEVTEPEVTYYYSMSEDDIYEFATLVYLESGIESFDCQCAVASVVLNRMTTRDMTLQEVIYEKDQFSPAHLIPYNSPDDSTLEAVRYVLENGPTIPEYVTYFRADYYFSWVEPYTYIDHTYFSYDTALAERLGY